MKRLIAGLLVGGMLLTMLPLPAAAGVAGDVALALGAFAVFNALLLPLTLASHAVYAASAPPVYEPRPAVYAAPPPAAARPAPSVAREVVYPHGRYVLYGDGVTRAYQWIWIPNPPPPGSAPGY